MKMTWREHRLREPGTDVTGAEVTCSCQHILAGEHMEEHLRSDKHANLLAGCRERARKRAAAYYERKKDTFAECECGVTCLERGLARHKKTAKHSWRMGSGNTRLDREGLAQRLDCGDSTLAGSPECE